MALKTPKTLIHAGIREEHRARPGSPLAREHKRLETETRPSAREIFAEREGLLAGTHVTTLGEAVESAGGSLTVEGVRRGR